MKAKDNKVLLFYRIKFKIFFSFLLMSLHFVVGGDSLNVQASEEKVFGSVARIPGFSESKNGGFIIDIINAVGKSYPQFDYELVPFFRSLQRLKDSDVDFQYPVIAGDILGSGFIESSEFTSEIEFSLYYNENSIVTIDSVSGKEQQVVPTVEKIHENSFSFQVKPSTCTECIMKKINNGREVAGIYASLSADAIIKSAKLTHVKSVPFSIFRSRFAFKDNEKGRKLEKEFSKIIRKLKDEGEFPSFDLKMDK